MTTLLFDGRTRSLEGAEQRGEELWIRRPQLEAATGWELRSEGLCQGDVCIPVPPGARWSDAERVSVTDFARHLRRPVLHDTPHDVWSVGPEPGGSRLASGVAPDFTLPDFEGRLHSLSQYRGKKVLLMTWASW